MKKSTHESLSCSLNCWFTISSFDPVTILLKQKESNLFFFNNYLILLLLEMSSLVVVVGFQFILNVRAVYLSAILFLLIFTFYCGCTCMHTCALISLLPKFLWVRNIFMDFCNSEPYVQIKYLLNIFLNFYGTKKKMLGHQILFTESK